MNITSPSKFEAQLDIRNTEKAFAYKSNRAIGHTYYIFKLLQRPSLVRALTGLANLAIKYRLPADWLFKKTVFPVFCAGETIEETLKVIQRINAFHVSAVLDYVSENEQTLGAFEHNKQVILDNILQLGQSFPDHAVSVKLTALEDPAFLSLISRKMPDVPKEHSQRFHTFIHRVDAICAAAHRHRIVVYIDAEDRDMQDLFDVVVEQMMEKYNTEKAVVYNTLQMYLTDRLNYLDNLLSSAREKKYHPGIKLVRGAYVEKERLHAKAHNKPSPIHRDKDATDTAFNSALEICLSQSPLVYTCVASHNTYSTVLATILIQRWQITDHFQKVRFSQLYGMKDYLTFNLAAAGFNASKYIPYGEVRRAIPYLMRRAEENTAIAGQISDELTFLQKELKRRKQQG